MNVPPLGGAIDAIVGAAGQAADTIMRNTPASGGHFTVNHDNVLAAAKVIQTQLDTLKDRVTGALQDLAVVPPGEDIVSKRVAESWNDRLIRNPGSYQQRVNEYVQSLQNLVDQLVTSAHDYGYNEDQISAALGGNRSA
ncbi:PE domain-containing protein [Actinokineospora sp. NBRC 105648]|uniref:PE domain-containing protein n=1 Tax=Actinokineospora sp. NBRC 105648 TaxID=3032206 RepID=UPI0024A375AD|nr:PE domain-containing protein [Actinokineospora sp. NBRC 105648]GLZ37593.1 hypothetical protein Acsp05_12180 [Actinokineospora sp. NBRC 105648]